MPYDDRERAIQGADYTWIATIKVNAADPLVKAWLTLKINLADADPGVLQKAVTTGNVAGTGQITNTGSVTGLATIRFDLTAAQMAALSPQTYLFDVKAKTTSGAFAYGSQGRFDVTQNVTTTTV